MEESKATETKIGATTYTVERVFSDGAKENALQAIKRLLLQQARSEGQEKLSIGCPNSLAMCEIARQYGRDTYK